MALVSIQQITETLPPLIVSVFIKHALLWLMLALLLAWLFSKFKKRKFGQDNTRITHDWGDELDGLEGCKQKRVMSVPEAVLYLKLSKALPNRTVLAQVSMSAFLFDMRQRSKISQKYVDFLICTLDMRPMVVVELDDKSHLREDRMESDAVKNRACALAKIKMVRYQAKNLPTVDEIIRDINTQH